MAITFSGPDVARDKVTKNGSVQISGVTASPAQTAAGQVYNATTPGYITRPNYVPARSLEQLAYALQDPGYQLRDEQTLRQLAENLYRNQYEAAKLSAQQQYDTAALGLRNQRNTLATGYDRQYAEQQAANRQSIAAADRRAMSRGMQRSSYNSAILGNMALAGDKALNQISENRRNDEQALTEQEALLANQLQQNLGAAESSYQNSILAAIQQMQEQDYDRRQNAINQANALQMQLYELGQQDEQLGRTGGSGGSSGGGGGGGGGSSSSNSTTINGGDTTVIANGPLRDYSDPGLGNSGSSSGANKISAVQAVSNTKLNPLKSPVTANFAAASSPATLAAAAAANPVRPTTPQIGTGSGGSTGWANAESYGAPGTVKKPAKTTGSTSMSGYVVPPYLTLH